MDSATTEWNPNLDLSLRKGRYYLTTTNAVYSFGDLYDNFSATFQQLDFSKLKLDSVLILGFAMGSVPFMLEKKFNKKFNCTGVEVDSKIVEWAKRYTLPDLTNPTAVLNADALAFVTTCKQHFDLVVVDLFLDDLVPSQFESLHFLIECKGLLNQDGLFLFNRLADTADAAASTQSFFLSNFKTVFPAADYLELGGNWILANKKAW